MEHWFERKLEITHDDHRNHKGSLPVLTHTDITYWIKSLPSQGTTHKKNKKLKMLSDKYIEKYKKCNALYVLLEQKVSFLYFCKNIFCYLCYLVQCTLYVSTYFLIRLKMPKVFKYNTDENFQSSYHLSGCYEKFLLKWMFQITNSDIIFAKASKTFPSSVSVY